MAASLSSLPNETLLQIFRPRQEIGERTAEFWRRLATMGSLDRRLMYMARPSLYKTVRARLHDSIAPNENPAQDYIRHLRRNQAVLGETTFLEVDGMIEVGPHDEAVYQTISIEQLARAAGYVPNCAHIQLLYLEILDPDGEYRSRRREIMAREHPSLLEITEADIEAKGRNRSIGAKTAGGERERLRRRREEEDAAEKPEGPPPTSAPQVRSLVIEETYNTTGNAILAAISLFPNAERVTLDDIHWRENAHGTQLVPDVPNHRIRYLSCVDITYDLTDYIHSGDGEAHPLLPLLAYSGFTNRIETLHLGFSDGAWPNGPDMLSWGNIPFENYSSLGALTLSTSLTYYEVDLTSIYFFRAIATLLPKVPPTLRTVHIVLCLEARDGEHATRHLHKAFWEWTRNAMPAQIATLAVTFALDTQTPIPKDRSYIDMIHKAFGNRARPQIAIRHMAKSEWLRALTADTFSETDSI